MKNSDDAVPRSLQILVVDDNETLCRAVVSMIRWMGHQVDAAGNGLEALSASARKRYDAMLLDVQMPVMNGVQTAFALKGYGIWIIGMSADPAEQEEFRAAGVTDFFPKPVVISHLLKLFGRAPVLVLP